MFICDLLYRLHTDGGCLVLVAKLCLTLSNATECLSMRFPRQEHWNGLPFPSPGDLPHPRIKPKSSALVGGFFTTEPPGNPYLVIVNHILEWHMRKMTTSFLEITSQTTLF